MCARLKSALLSGTNKGIGTEGARARSKRHRLPTLETKDFKPNRQHAGSEERICSVMCGPSPA